MQSICIKHQNIYVSDLLEDILNASRVRDLAREITFEVIGSLHPELDKITAYIGGKCMGYPSLWLIKNALNINLEDFKEHLKKNYSALFVSLSTSIGDDLVDNDEDTNIGHLGLFYLLLFNGLTSSPNAKVNKVIYENGIHVMKNMLNDESIIDLSMKDVDLEIERFGLKIGLFHKMIAYEFLNTYDNDADHEFLLKLSEDFGCWCSEVDDFIDIERDVENKQYFTRPVIQLIKRDESSKTAVLENNLITLKPIIDSNKYVSLNVDLLVHKMKDMTEALEKKGFLVLSSKLRKILLNLPSKLFKARKLSSELYLANNGHIFN